MTAKAAATIEKWAIRFVSGKTIYTVRYGVVQAAYRRIGRDVLGVSVVHRPMGGKRRQEAHH